MLLLPASPRGRLILLAGLVVAALGAPAAYGAPAYLKIDDIQCEADHPRYTGWCEVSTFSFGGSSSSAGNFAGGGAAQAAAIGDVNIVKPIDLGTPFLFQAFAQGRHLRDVSLSFVKTVGRSELEYLRIELSDCIISKVNYGFGEEGLSIAWVRIRMIYRTGRPDGLGGGREVVVTWDKRLGRSF